MIIDVQDRVNNLIHKVEGFLKDIKQEKESLDREVLLEEKPFKVNEYTEGDIEWEDFDDDVKTQIEEGTSISDLTRIFNGFLKIRSEELRGNKPKVSVLRDGRDFLMRIEDGYTLRVVLEEVQRTRDQENGYSCTEIC